MASIPAFKDYTTDETQKVKITQRTGIHTTRTKTVVFTTQIRRINILMQKVQQYSG